MNATKERYGKAQLGALFADASQIIVAKGKRLTTFDMQQDPPSASELAKAVLGPTGNLRAPAIKTGKTWTIGFHPDLFEERFG